METIRFRVTKNHIKLLQRKWVYWQDEKYSEYLGNIYFDPKRPYGNSDIIGDIAEICGWKLDREKDYTTKLVNKAKKLHKETAIALEICLCTLSFKPGLYECEKYEKDWVIVK